MMKDVLRATLFITVLFVFAGDPLCLWGGMKAGSAADKNQPIQIDSDRLEAYTAKKLAVFSGNVVAVQGTRTLRAESLTVYYKEGKKDSTGSLAPEGFGAIDKMEAKGHVSITDGEKIAEGNYAVFEQATQKITLRGDAVLKEGKNVIKGDTVIVYLEEDRGVVERGENRRVTATIFPGEKD